MDRRNYNRTVYAIFDFASDVGGLYGALSPLCITFLLMINFWSSYQFLMGDLFIGGHMSKRKSKMKKVVQKQPKDGFAV